MRVTNPWFLKGRESDSSKKDITMDTVNANNVDYSEILNLFQDKELSEKILELLKAGVEISQKEPVIGFHHSFYVPGWIGFIQETIVEKKMNKFVELPFYHDKNYYEFGNWFSIGSKEVAEMLVKSKETYNTSDELYEKQCMAINNLYTMLLNSWVDCCPEVATYCNQQYTQDTMISPAGLMYKNLCVNLKPLGFKEGEAKSSSGKSFVEDVKGGLYMIAGYVLNCLLLAAIFGLGSLIFG